MTFAIKMMNYVFKNDGLCIKMMDSALQIMNLN